MSSDPAWRRQKAEMNAIKPVMGSNIPETSIQGYAREARVSRVALKWKIKRYACLGSLETEKLN